MPRFNLKNIAYRPTKPLVESWASFRKGFNGMLRQTELDNEELAVMTNLRLVGKGVPTGRWGLGKYFSAGSDGSVRSVPTFKSSSVDEILAITDEGYLVKKDGSSYARVSGQSWPSGSIVRSEQLGGKTYLVSKDTAFTEYDGDIKVFSKIGVPTGLSATNFSGATGPASTSYRVVAVGSNGGQTEGSANYVLNNLPTDLEGSTYHVFWTAPSHATLSGYEIYRGRQGDELLLASIGPEQTKYVDSGGATAITAQVPVTNTTGGVKSNFIKKYKDRLLVVPADDPSKLVISGRYPSHTKFSWLDGGGYIYIDPDSGDDITGIAVQPIADRIIVYKNRSSYIVELGLLQVGPYWVLDPKYEPISTSVGCSSADTLATVENDTFYFGRDGLYVTGYEPNYLNIIRTNEISAKIRPYLDALSAEDYSSACAFYVDKKYILSFPRRKEAVVYDRERGAWLGKWAFPFGLQTLNKYVDDDGNESWVVGSSESPDLYTFSVSTNSDDGTTITKTLRTKKSYFGDWSVLNIVQYFYFLFRNVSGFATVNILAEGRDGVTSVLKSFTISGFSASSSTGWGMDKWGSTLWGNSEYTSVSISSEEISRWGTLFKQARLVQIEIICSEPNSNFELLEAKIKATKMGGGALSSAQRV